MIYKILLFLGVICNVTAQYLLKYVMKGKNLVSTESFSFSGIFGLIAQPLFLLSIFVYGIGFFLYAISLSKLELSKAYPVASIAAIVIISIISFIFFQEVITPFKVIGILLCLGGIIFIFI